MEPSAKDATTAGLEGGMVVELVAGTFHCLYSPFSHTMDDPSQNTCLFQLALADVQVSLISTHREEMVQRL